MAAEQPLTVMFNGSKGELYTPIQGFKDMAKRLMADFHVSLNKDELSYDVLEKAKILVVGCPQEKFSTLELESVKEFVRKGGSLLFLGGDGGDVKKETNGNDLLQDYGIYIKPNCLISTVQEKYLHPKEVLLRGCNLCDELNQFVRCKLEGTNFTALTSPRLQRFQIKSEEHEDAIESLDDILSIVYPHGPTLVLQRPAVAILSSGPFAHPVRQPIGALWENGEGHGKVAAVGSAMMFGDEWINKENNIQLLEFLIMWLSGKIVIKIYGFFNNILEIQCDGKTALTFRWP